MPMGDPEEFRIFAVRSDRRRLCVCTTETAEECLARVVAIYGCDEGEWTLSGEDADAPRQCHEWPEKRHFVFVR